MSFTHVDLWPDNILVDDDFRPVGHLDWQLQHVCLSTGFHDCDVVSPALRAVVQCL